VLLIDEPLSNLDAKLRVQMRAEIASIQRELGVTTVYVTHDQVEAMTMGDRVAVLKDGYLPQVDTPQQLYDRPANVFVGAFIGSPSMTLYSGSLDLDGGGGIVTLGSQTMALSPALAERRRALRGYDGRQVVVGIRPEDFEDAAIETDVPEADRLQSRAQRLEALGSEIIVHFSIDAPIVDSGDPDEHDDVAHDGVNAVGRFGPRSRVSVGDPVDVAVTAENLHFSDAQTRQAIYD
jgi:multiple sugar transport system ATP-binding protein